MHIKRRYITYSFFIKIVGNFSLKSMKLFDFQKEHMNKKMILSISLIFK